MGKQLFIQLFMLTQLLFICKTRLHVWYDVRCRCHYHLWVLWPMLYESISPACSLSWFILCRAVNGWSIRGCGVMRWCKQTAKPWPCIPTNSDSAWFHLTGHIVIPGYMVLAGCLKYSVGKKYWLLEGWSILWRMGGDGNVMHYFTINMQFTNIFEALEFDNWSINR